MRTSIISSRVMLSITSSVYCFVHANSLLCVEDGGHTGLMGANNVA